MIGERGDAAKCREPNEDEPDTGSEAVQFESTGIMPKTAFKGFLDFPPIASSDKFEDHDFSGMTASKPLR